MKKNNKNIVVWGLVITMFLIMMQVSSNTIKSSSAPNEYTFSELESEVASSKIAEAEINEAEGLITGETADGKRFRANTSRIDDRAGELFDEYNVPYEYSKVKGTNTLAAMFINVLPLLLIIGVSMLIFRSMQGGGRGGAMSFGKSRAKMLTENTNRVTFEDVAGVESAKEDLKEVVEFLEDPSRFTRLGARIPTGALLVGPPGTGKTMLGKAAASLSEVQFMAVSGPELLSKWVGESERAVRELFQAAQEAAPVVIFFDEFDALGRQRDGGEGSSHSNSVVAQLLSIMDGLGNNEDIYLMASTNQIELVDRAFLRPGRFERAIHVGPLPKNSFKRFFENEVKECLSSITEDQWTVLINRMVDEATGADLFGLINTAKRYAVSRSIEHGEFDASLEERDMIAALASSPHLFAGYANELPEPNDWNDDDDDDWVIP